MENIIKKGTRHFATANRQSVLVLGFNAPTNTVYLVNLEQMSSDESAELRRIALSPAAQNVDTLAGILENTTHSKSGRPWLEIIWSNLGNRWIGSTFVDNLSDMNQDQKNYFKGYGKSQTPKEVLPEETNHMFRPDPRAPQNVPEAVVPDEEDDDEYSALDAGETDDETPEPAPAPVPARRAPSAAPPAQYAPQQGVTAQQMDQLIGLMSKISKGLDAQHTDVRRLLARVPGKPGRPTQPPAKPKVVTGKPSPAEIIGGPDVQQG